MYNILIIAGAIVTASASSFMDSVINLSIHNCTDNEYVCDNFQCIPGSKRCDQKNDCSDSSDEINCEMFLCHPPEFFRCKNGRCLSSAFVCDTENDCEDFSDEENCADFKKLLQTNSTCEKNHWQCTDRLCILEEWVCNGEPDCLDGSDEIIGCSRNITCDGFKCKNGHCIIAEWRCDGQDDCRDNSDETNCDSAIAPTECTLESQRFLCKDGKTCIKLNQVCDAVAHCLDKSDEGPLCNQTCSACSHECVRLPSGPQCICPKGYHTLADNNCQDINECEKYGICDQKCKNLPGSYQCSCDEHYSLMPDKINCKAHFGEALLFFSSKEEIRSFSLKSEIYLPVVKNLRQVVGVDYDGQYIYWTDIFSEHESILKAPMDGSKKELLVTSGLGSPEDLQIDHITGNIYFTDAERQHIGVCTKDGVHCTVIVNKDIHKPRGIVLDSAKGVMYWTDWGRQPEIARAFMDGSNDTSFVSNNIHWPNGLAIDHPNERLYWTDAKLMSLESVKLDGTDRRVILEGIVKHPYAIAVFESKIYWSDWATHSIQSCDKFTGKNHHTLIKENEDFIYGITIYHPNNRRNNSYNPCAFAHCSDICLLSGQSYTCACPQNKELDLHKHSCKNNEKRQKLILGVENMLIDVEHKILGKHEVKTLSVFVKKIGAMAYNSVENVLYLSDLNAGKIISFDLHLEISKLVEAHDLGEVISMGYDYLGNNLYWCDSEKKTVEVLNLNTKARKILLHDMHEEIPQSLALVPEEGVMFVAFQKSKQETHIDRIFMDGTGRSHSIENGFLGPVSLYYDSDLHRIFIADAQTGNIESTSVEGDDRHRFRSLKSAPAGITCLKREIFWVNKNSRQLHWADKYNSGEQDCNKKITLDLPDDVENMRIVSITPRKTGLSPCQHHNGNCSHLCLHSLKNVVCACPNGMVLDIDNQTCITRTECNFNEFFCRASSTCIFKTLRCDGKNDCPSGEDEDGCKNDTHCSIGQFQCQDGECIKQVFKCDTKYDCKDKSDEHNCNNLCPPNHFRCTSGQCIKDRFVCDGVNDCRDKEDEADCVSTVCKESEFRCSSGACIPKNWECDHDYDCPDMSDEHSGCNVCAPTTFTCSNEKCVDVVFVCDNENDCGDNSDEMSCDRKTENCHTEEFACSNHAHICLPPDARCNGTSECPHHEDEQNCSNCHIDEFACKNRKCIPTQWLCDRTNDCGDNSDEESALCNNKVPDMKIYSPCDDRFQCKSGNCIDFSLVCNGKPDCFDGSDEDGACSTSCNAINNPCNQICIETPTGPICKCKDGYQLQGDGGNCQDINECDAFPPVCSQICNNIGGGHLCDCYEGFVIKNDKVSCKSEGKFMSMFFTTENQIQELSQNENSLKLVLSEDTPRITGLDVSAQTGSLYYSIQDSRSILMINKDTSIREYIEEVGQPQQIALDWMTNNIYYVNNEANSKSISVCNFQDKSCATLIPIDIHRQISAIAVDATNKLLFYSLVSWQMLNSPNYVIYKTNLDGTNIQELIKSASGYVTGLTFDPYKKKLYFVDLNTGELSQIRYDGLQNTVLASNLTRPRGLSLFENHLYFLTTGGYLGVCRIFSPVSCHSLRLNKHSNDLFTIAQQSRQPRIGANLCKNHTCSHICLPSKSDYKCLCWDGKLILPGEECDFLQRESYTNEARKILAIHHIEHLSPHIGPVVVGITISVCLLTLGVLCFYFVKRRNSDSVNISMRFHNPAYGIKIDDSEKKSILQPGQHEYTNPVEIVNAEKEETQNETLLINV